jgi:D-sedoheptulose 7-phosphate isomerase
MNYISKYLNETKKILNNIEKNNIYKIVDYLKKLKKKKGRIFFLGVGGSAANCSHAVNDFRKICKIECYTPTDNVAEITARTNDEGWDVVFVNWLKISNLKEHDILFIFSVGGGNIKKNISINLIEAIKYGKSKKCKIIGIVGKKNGYTAKNSDVCLIIPEVSSENITPHAEEFQSIIWHLLVSHPHLKDNNFKYK